MKKNRLDYKEIIDKYDFLDFITEIENYNLNGELASQKIQNEDNENIQFEVNLNQSVLNQSIVNEGDVSQINLRNKGDKPKRSKLSLDTNLVFSIDVNQDILQEQLEQLEKIHEQLTQRLNIQEEQLSK